MIQKKILIILLFALYCCKKNDKSFDNHIKKVTVTLNENKFDSILDDFLKFPLQINSEGKLVLNNLPSFDIKYKISKNKYSDSIVYSNDLDSIISYRFTNGDTINFFKNKYTKKIILLKLSSSGFNLNNGVYIGMPFLEFTKLFRKLKINGKDSIASYEDEFTYSKFIFVKGRLNKVIYENMLE